MNESAAKRALEKIDKNISEFGHHNYYVTEGESPRYFYTIGVALQHDFELIFAGGAFYTAEEVFSIINEIVGFLSADGAAIEASYKCSAGKFTLRACDKSWLDVMMLGAFDYWGERVFGAYQILPEERYMTIDTPDLSTKFFPQFAGAWRWLVDDWQNMFPKKSVAITNIAALKGQKVTEIARWEEDEWEMFSGSGPDVEDGDVRIVPLCTLISYDPSLKRAVGLKVGEAVWRDKDTLRWVDWSTKK